MRRICLNQRLEAELQATIFGMDATQKKNIRLNGAIYTLCTVLTFIASSADEAELGALFLISKKEEY